MFLDILFAPNYLDGLDYLNALVSLVFLKVLDALYCPDSLYVINVQDDLHGVLVLGYRHYRYVINILYAFDYLYNVYGLIDIDFLYVLEPLYVIHSIHDLHSR